MASVKLIEVSRSCLGEASSLHGVGVIGIAGVPIEVFTLYSGCVITRQCLCSFKLVICCGLSHL